MLNLSSSVSNGKHAALSYANGDLEKAKAIYAWLIEAPEVITTGNVPVEVKTPKAEPKPPKEQKTKPTDAPKAETPKTEPSADDKPTLDYQKDVVPKIAAAAAKYGKPALLALFESQFGASNAKEIPAERWGDLIAAIDNIGGDNV